MLLAIGCDHRSSGLPPKTVIAMRTAWHVLEPIDDEGKGAIVPPDDHLCFKLDDGTGLVVKTCLDPTGASAGHSAEFETRMMLDPQAAGVLEVSLPGYPVFDADASSCDNWLGVQTMTFLGAQWSYDVDADCKDHDLHFLATISGD
jgi:hypothetical protein